MKEIRNLHYDPRVQVFYYVGFLFNLSLIVVTLGFYFQKPFPKNITGMKYMARSFVIF